MIQLEMIAQNKYKRLLEPGRIGAIRIRNRIVKPAQSMHYASEDGFVTERNIAFYEAIARGGAGLIIVEMASIDLPLGSYSGTNDPAISDDRFVQRLGDLAEAIHRHGAVAFLQLNHAGPGHHPVHNTQPRSSSSLSWEERPVKRFSPPKGLTISEVEDLVEKFARAAERACRAGFDGVEVHGAHSYLINSFFSPVWNKREDRYGGSLENRSRFACDILRAINTRTGRDFAVGFRMNGAEYGANGGTTMQEAQAISKLLEEAGADCIHVSAGGYGNQYEVMTHPEQIFYPEAPKPLPKGFDGSRKGRGGLTLLAAGVRRVVSVPVITVGGIGPRLAEKVLKEGRADFVAIGRGLLADPDLPRKVMEGRERDIAPCTACFSCQMNYGLGRPVICRINASLGKELEYAIKPAEKSKSVVVVGGGPAGMEAARVASLRGHRVTLFERGHRLGGLTPIAALVKGLDVENLPALVRYYRSQFRRLGVQVKLGKEVDAGLIQEMSPDAVVLAVGGVTGILAISRTNKKIMVDQARFNRTVKALLWFFGPRLLGWLTRVYLPVGRKVVIVGGGIQGLQLAVFLVKRGRKVVIVEESPDRLGAGLAGTTIERMLNWLDKRGCLVLTGVKCEEVTEAGLAIITGNGNRQTLATDAVLPALPLNRNCALFESLQDSVPELYVTGDAANPNLILEAVADGFKTGLTI